MTAPKHREASGRKSRVAKKELEKLLPISCKKRHPPPTPQQLRTCFFFINSRSFCFLP